MQNLSLIMEKYEKNKKRIREHYSKVLRHKNTTMYGPQFLKIAGQYLIREPSDSWWSTIEINEEPSAKAGDTFLCRRDEGTFRGNKIIFEYGSTFTDDGKWIRHTVAFLSDEPSPYPFFKDCYSNDYRFKYIGDLNV